jgi:hypothetical protein
MTTAILNPSAPARAGARKLVRAAALAVSALALACGAAQAAPHGGFHGGGGWHGGGGYYHGYHGGYYRGGWGPGPFWGGIGLGLGLGVIGASIYDSPDYVVVNPAPPVVYASPPAVVYPAPAVAPAPAPAAPDPIFYPRNGQSPQQTEADRQACNRWATTQPAAMADGSVFHRATLACMDGRGYTAR